MSATLNPNYFSKSAERNKSTMCDCGRRALNADLKMDPEEPGTQTCTTCRAEKAELRAAFEPLIA